MKIFFVRHGETTFNKLRLFQGPDVELSDIGKEQAQKLGQRLKDFKFTKAYCSDFYRAQQTARIIADHSHIQFKANPLLREWLSPSRFFGKGSQDFESLKIIDDIQKRRLTDHSYKFEDEETYQEVIERLGELQHFIEQHDAHDSLLIVSHGRFIRMFYLYLQFKAMQEDMTYQRFLPLDKMLKTKNTGITIYTYTHKEWLINVWNDHAHL